MLLSIIIPVYNVESYLSECLDSIFAQDLTDCEVIAVNDGSTDGSCGILEEYKEKYPSIITVFDQANGGQGSARNLGVCYAKGRFIYFMDSDDYLKPHAIASIKHAIDSAVGADVFYLDCIVTERGQRCWEHDKDVLMMKFRDFFIYAYYHGISVVPNPFSYVYSSSYWRKSGLHYEEGIKYEDSLFESQLFVRDDGTIKVIHVEKPFYVYRVGREGSTTTSRSIDNFVDLQYIRKKIYDMQMNLGIKDIAFYHGLSYGCATMFYEAFESGLIGKYRKFWDKEDVRIMRRGVTNEREYGFWLLAKLNPIWMARYYANDLSNLQRRLTNILLTVCAKLFYRGKRTK